MPQAVLSIGAGCGQFSLIKAAYDLGYRVIAVDRAPSSLCLEFLTDVIAISTYEVHDVIKALDVIKQHYDFKGVLVRSSGQALVTAALVAEHLSVAGVSLAFAKAAVSKSQLRYECVDEAIPTTKGVKMTEMGVPPFSAPWVIKPDIPVVGKQNVYLVTDDAICSGAPFEQAFLAAQEESINGYVEVEGYIEGVDVGYMAVLCRGEVVFDLIYDEYVDFRGSLARTHGLGVAGPSVYTGTQVEVRIRDAAIRMLKRWGEHGGFAFCSFRVNKCGEVFLYEVNPGLCGDAIADLLLPALWPGFNAFQMEVLAVLGEDVHPPLCNATHSSVLGGVVATYENFDQQLEALTNRCGASGLSDTYHTFLTQLK